MHRLDGPCKAGNVSVGRGAYLEGGQIYAALAGQLRRLAARILYWTMLEVVLDGSGEALVPTVGATVLARVSHDHQASGAEVVRLQQFRGIIRKQDVRFFEALLKVWTGTTRVSWTIGVLNSSERDDPTELSEVSFLSRDRDFVDTKHFSDDSDEEDHLLGRRQNLLGYAMASCGVCALFALVLLFHSFSGSSSSTLWTSATAWGSPSEDFVDLGEGLCMGVQRELIPKYNSSDPLELFSEMSASQCPLAKFWVGS
ncbi:unnamed protein product [Cladocopium goreaui]|uniref:Exosome complex component CSL4 n=1 Tax=Cladocopium goreaui TaxID=2562237 RepID=A0A9P1BFI4_9DINO|nr:unnamed protein product [Cladocopium goreaui]